MNTSTVIVNVSGAGLGTIHVDGVQIKSVQSVSVAIAANEAPAVNLRLAVREGAQIRLDGATLVIDEAVIPAGVELALWRLLKEKYGRAIDVTTMSSTAREWILGDR